MKQGLIILIALIVLLGCTAGRNEFPKAVSRETRSRRNGLCLRLPHDVLQFHLQDRGRAMRLQPTFAEGDRFEDPGRQGLCQNRRRPGETVFHQQPVNRFRRPALFRGLWVPAPDRQKLITEGREGNPLESGSPFEYRRKFLSSSPQDEAGQSGSGPPMRRLPISRTPCCRQHLSRQESLSPFP